jgi:hypothetical protein
MFFKEATVQIGTTVMARVFNAELLAKSQLASGRSCDRPTRSSSMVFLGPRANAEFVPKFQVGLHASHAAYPIVTLKLRPNATFAMSDYISLECSPSNAIRSKNLINSDHMLYPCEKDLLALPGKLLNRSYCLLDPKTQCISHYHPHFIFSLSKRQ